MVTCPSRSRNPTPSHQLAPVRVADLLEAKLVCFGQTFKIILFRRFFFVKITEKCSFQTVCYCTFQSISEKLPIKIVSV